LRPCGSRKLGKEAQKGPTCAKLPRRSIGRKMKEGKTEGPID